MTSTYYSGIAGLMTPAVIRHLATIYPSVAVALGQYPENSQDAGATKIWVVLEPNRIIVVDNGHGMVPEMLPDDLSIVAMYREDIANGRMDPTHDLAEFIESLNPGSPSLRSIQWMMECIGLSPKRVTGGRVQGIRGIGSLAFLQLGEQARWWTKPSRELAGAFWGKERRAKNVPNLTFEALSSVRLERGDLTYNVEETEVPFLSPGGQVLDHGTMVEITELKEGTDKSLRPNLVVEAFREKFGDKIREGRFELVVVDRVSEEGRRTSGGRELYVPAAHYPGRLIWKGNLALRGSGQAEFELEVYYDPRGRALAPVLRRLGEGRGPITKLAELDKEPWNSGKLSGFVDFPELPESLAPWDSSKETPLNSSVRNQWQNALWGIADELSAAIAQIDEESKSRNIQDVLRNVGDAAIRALNELSDFSDLEILTEDRKRRRQSEEESLPHEPEGVLDRVIVRVLNEHNRGTRGIRVELLQGSDVLLYRETESSGTVSLGKYPYGRYKVRLRVPRGVKVVDEAEVVFNLSANQPGARLNFHVVTGEPPPETKLVPGGINLFVYPWEMLEQPYRGRLDRGTVEINSQAPDFVFARQAGDFETLRILCADYVASAVAEYADPEEHERGSRLVKATRLFGAMVRQLQSRGGAGKTRKG